MAGTHGGVFTAGPLARRTILGKWLCTLVAGGVLLALAGREVPGSDLRRLPLYWGQLLCWQHPVLEWWAYEWTALLDHHERAIAMTREHRICSMELKEIDDVCLVQGENGMHLSFWERLLEKQGGKALDLRAHFRGQLRPGEAEGRR